MGCDECKNAAYKNAAPRLASGRFELMRKADGLQYFALSHYRIKRAIRKNGSETVCKEHLALNFKHPRAVSVNGAL